MADDKLSEPCGESRSQTATGRSALARSMRDRRDKDLLLIRLAIIGHGEVILPVLALQAAPVSLRQHRIQLD